MSHLTSAPIRRLRAWPLLAAFVTVFPAPAAWSRVFESFADVAERAIPGVVNIRTTTYAGAKDPAQDLYQFFLKGPLTRTAATHAVGSGVVIDRAGHVLTNHHVISGASLIEVLFAKSKTKVQAKVVGSDPKSDLAVLAVQLPSGAQPLDLGDSDKLRVGDIVLAIGNPFGYAHTVTSGIISAKGRVIGAGPYDNFLQTDAAIHPGNSGGPLLDLRSRVIGINTAVAAEGPGIGFAIPINLAHQITRDLVRFGKVKRPFIGLVGKNILSSDEAQAGDRLGGLYGVIVDNLIVEGPAHHAGLLIGDVILAVGDDKVLDLHGFHGLLAKRAPGDAVRLKVYRRAKGAFLVDLKLDEVPKATDLPVEKDLL